MPAVTKLFESTAVSELYAKVRPHASDALIRRIVDFVGVGETNKGRVAMDVGCGVGFTTVKFLEYFHSVIGLDVSQSQVEKARSSYSDNKDVQFNVCSSDNLTSQSQPGSVDLVTCFQAAHWLDLPRFYKQCDIILKPRGVIAFACYPLLTVKCKAQPSVEDQLNAAVNKFHNALHDGQHWEPQRWKVDRLYDDVTLPYEEQVIARNDPSLFYEKEMSYKMMVDYFTTLSGWRTCLERQPDTTLLTTLQEELLTALNGNEETMLTGVFRFFLMMCKKP